MTAKTQNLSRTLLAICASAMVLNFVASIVTAADIEQGGSGGSTARKYDLDRNGKLDSAERAALIANAKLAKAKFDKNKDGKLDPAERTAAERAWLAEQHRRKADAKAQILREFDQDKDGQLSVDEKKAMIAEQRRRAASDPKERGR